jgi:penicillin-binding protein 1A
MGKRGSKSRYSLGDGAEGSDAPAEAERPRGRRKRRATPPARGARSRWRWALWGLVAAGGAGLIGAAVLAGLFLHYARDPRLPAIEKLADYRPPQVTRVLDREGRLLGTLGSTERRTVVPYAKISKHLVNAVVAAEDPGFWQHEGVDLRGVLRAALENTLQGRWGRRAQGGSTITQQVVKLLLLTPEKSARRKLQEMILARRLSQKLRKEDILAIYLNHVSFGHPHYGVEEAARFYFGKGASDVGLAEAALLAGLPQLPERHSPHKNPESAKNRQRYVLGQMARHGYIDQATAARLAAEPIKVQDPQAAEAGYAPEALATVHRFLVDRHGADKLPALGAEVKTTIDLELQGLARRALERGLEELDERQGYRGPTSRLAGKALERHRAALQAALERDGLKDGRIVEGVIEEIARPLDAKQGGRLIVDVGGRRGVVDLALETRYDRGGKPLADRLRPGDVVRVRPAPERRRRDGDELPLALELGPQAALVVMDPQTRDVLALVGGYGFRPGGFDRSQRAERQPGSAFKPFVYAAAIDSQRFTAASIVNDSPDVYEGAAGGQDWKPQNYQKESYRGPVRLRAAIAESINTVAVKLVDELTVPTVIDYAARCGILTPVAPDIGLSIALGSNTTKPIELANAYATLAAGGQRGETRLVTAVGDETIPPAPFVAALRPETAYVIVSLLRSVVEEGTAKAAGAKLKRPLAGKTGTSNKMRDTWFVGFSPDLLAAVWVGFDDGRSLGRAEAGARTALPIWTAFMEKALATRPVHDFTQPAGVTVARIDPRSGLLAPAGADALDEVFLDGTVPEPAASAGGSAADADRLLLGP